MKKIFLYLSLVLFTTACGDDGNTGNPPADVPALDDQGPAIRDTNSGEARDHDTGKAYRDTSFYPK